MTAVAWCGQRPARASCRPGRRGGERCGAPADTDTSSTALLGTVPGQGAALPASPESPPRGRGNWLRRGLCRLRALFSKKPAAPDSTQTGYSERQPLYLTQDHSRVLATRRVVLSAQHSSSAQPELKQQRIAQLQHELAALRAQQTLSARNEAAARRDALGAGLRLWHDEEKGRAEVLREMQSEWQVRMLALHAPCDQADDSAAEDPTPTQEAHDSVAAPGTGDVSLVLPESGASSRSPTHARECLFIDQICHWVASFVRRDWALVCSATAEAVLRVMLQVYDIWSSTTYLIGSFQTTARFRMDYRFFGSEDGPLVRAREAVLELRAKALRVGSEDDPNLRWCNRFLLHMQLTAHTYEEMRIRHRQIYSSLKDRATDLYKVLVTLEQTLEKYNARHATAADSHEATAIADPAPHGAEA